MPQVKIGSKFFRNELREYSDWKWAYVREAMQNCFDAPGSRNVSVRVDEYVGGSVNIEFANDGRPMDLDVLENKLLALGETGKVSGEGSVGGFGKAKVLLYFAHESWNIRSGSLSVTGSGGEYEITDGCEFLDGTRSNVVVANVTVEQVVDQLEKFAMFSQWAGTLTVNGKVLPTCMQKGARRRDLGFGTVFTNRSASHVMVVRIGGIPMFTEWCSLKRCVVVELNGSSLDILTSNRDGLIYHCARQLNSFVTELAVDKKSALKDRNVGPTYLRFAGRRLSHSRDTGDSVQPERELLVSNIVLDAVKDNAVVVAAPTPGSVAIKGVDIGADGGSFTAVDGEYDDSSVERFDDRAMSVQTVTVRQVATLGDEFILKNDTSLKVPGYYSPGSSEFSSYSRKLTRVWGRLMLALHRVFDVEADFAIGFVLSDESEAEFEDGRYGKAYLVNPAKVVEKNGSRSFSKRFKLTERNRLLSIALHEFVHGLGYGVHDENYSTKLTDMIAVVMDNRSQFNWCFK